MIKNKRFRKWYSVHFPYKYAKKMEDEINNDFLEVKNSNATREEIYEAKYERDFNLREIFDTLNEHYSDEIILKAKKYGCPVPHRYNSDGSIHEAWEESAWGTLYLSDESRYDLKMRIREEEKWKRERISFFSSLIFGLLGLLVGVLSQI
ncbi:hypothetical protein [Marispirochaeta aestuarii]|uniref:hypothetical protein n=1 Tax=Marispirochaeta aestuarii TaxID=1963862 RepID=UPI002ABE959B|nr:hypothetical protein [Marispirochaeta aestuarii]